MYSFDSALFTYINSFAGESHTRDIMAICVADYLPLLFIAFEIYLYFYKGERKTALSAFYAAMAGIVMNQLISIVYYRPRPFVQGLGENLVKHSADSSFPSDHTVFMAGIAFALILTKERRVSGYLFLVLSLIGGVARVYVGVHFPLDIAGGVTVGLISALLVSKYRKTLGKVDDKLNILVDSVIYAKVFFKKNRDDIE